MSAAPIVITSGEPSGVGPELCLNLLARPGGSPLVVVGDRNALAARAKMTGATLVADDFQTQPNSRRAILHCPADIPPQPGKPSAQNARHVLQQLNLAADGCKSGRFRAMVTAPVSKSVLRDAGIPFIGITEHLAELSGVNRAVMLMHSPSMRIALATTHIPLRAVADAITTQLLAETLTILDAELRKKFTNGKPPRISVAGLNPHAGEGGHCGREESEIIAPAIRAANRDLGINASGPFSADALFARRDFAPDECALAMYHDQALPAFKRTEFNRGVNVTLGLPFVRVSPDHGVAADIAGRGIVRPNSMRAALNLARRITQ